MTSLRCVCTVPGGRAPAGGAGPRPLRSRVGVIKPGQTHRCGSPSLGIPGLQFDLQHRFEMRERFKRKNRDEPAGGAGAELPVRPGAPAGGSWEPAGPRLPGSAEGRTANPGTFYQTKYNKFRPYKVFLMSYTNIPL